MSARTSQIMSLARAARVVPTARSFTTRAAARPALLPRAPAVQSRIASPAFGLRFKSETSTWASKPIIKYEELKPITQQPSDNILLVDVREPDEVALGSIPSAVNLPLSQLKEALDPKYNEGNFKKNFAFSKPLPSQNIIFFCRSGKRSASAAEQASKYGYKNIRNYEGSWLDWSRREKVESDED